MQMPEVNEHPASKGTTRGKHNESLIHWIARPELLPQIRNYLECSVCCLDINSERCLNISSTVEMEPGLHYNIELKKPYLITLWLLDQNYTLMGGILSKSSTEIISNLMLVIVMHIFLVYDNIADLHTNITTICRATNSVNWLGLCSLSVES